jgi:hypothetical protein
MTDPDPEAPEIPDAAVEAGIAVAERIAAAPDLEAERGKMPMGFVVRAILAAALPHLVTDEAVERAARVLHEVSDDVLPFDLHITEDMGRRDERARQNRIDQRRERYMTTARAALEAALDVRP